MNSRNARLAAYLLLLVFVIAECKTGEAQSYKVLYRFKGSPDGRQPNAPLIGGSVRGRLSLYGTTLLGGHACHHPVETCGTVFSLTEGAGERVIHYFEGRLDGGEPSGGLVTDSVGNGYGLTYQGGTAACHCGVAYRIDNASGAFSVLHSFAGPPSDGSQPAGTLLWDSVRGNFYGVTYSGGSGGTGGTVFAITPSGTETVLYNFCSLANCSDGENPISALVEDEQGNLYGTTAYGGGQQCEALPFACGTIFKIDNGGNETLLHTFTNGADGGEPFTGLVSDGLGNFYGTTEIGGNPDCSSQGSINGCGTVFKIDASGNFSVIHAFSGSEGAFPAYGQLVWNPSAGLLYGATGGGGAFNAGAIFEMDTSGNETVLYNFTGKGDGSGPNLGLILDSSGNFYGSTAGGGLDFGVIFRLTP